jgi:ABC-type amino acid transport substrate-binding protein
VGVQTGSAASWALEDALGYGATEQYGTLREALQALAAGKVRLVAGDALVGAYIARDLTAVRLVGQLGTALPLGVAVAKDNTVLADAVRTSLDDLAAVGTLKTIRRTWVGEIPELVVSQQD